MQILKTAQGINVSFYFTSLSLEVIQLQLFFFFWPNVICLTGEMYHDAFSNFDLFFILLGISKFCDLDVNTPLKIKRDTKVMKSRSLVTVLDY